MREYRSPVLSRLGTVAELMKGTLGSGAEFSPYGKNRPKQQQYPS